MPVGGEESGRDPGDAAQPVDRTAEGALGGEVVHVADVRGEPGPAALAQAEGVLQVTADGERGADRQREGDRQRSVPARTADRELLAVADPHHRVVARDVDRAVVGQPGVGERGEPDQRLGVVGDDRLAREVAAGQHQQPGAGRVAGQAEQQVVQRRVGQHHAQVRAARRDLLGEPRPARPAGAAGRSAGPSR